MKYLVFFVFLFLAACKTLSVEERAWNACIRAVETAMGGGAGKPQNFNLEGVHLDDTFADGTPVDWATYDGPRQYEVTVFYPESKGLYHCVMMYDPDKETWQVTDLSVK